MVFVRGQRWLSETENELGLGTVSAIDARRVELHFPVAGEERVYAVENAPLIRVRFQTGDVIRHQNGWQGRILGLSEQQGLIRYRVQPLEQDEEREIPEAELSGQFQFSQPQLRLFGGQIDRNEQFATRFAALQMQQAQFQSPLRGLRGFRAALIPHQLHIAREVGGRIAPRVLLADEVGLGKTLEAGMILYQQWLAGKVERALIVVPESLQHQWLVEMLRRFNLHFSLFDEERCVDFAPREEAVQAGNPFENESLIICALDWLVAQPLRAQQALAAGFDMLIVDEAHHLRWSPDAPSAEYVLVEALSLAIDSVLLLTATPQQLGLESHFARLRLLDPDRFYDYQAFLAEQRHYLPLAKSINCLLNHAPLNSEENARLRKLLGQSGELLLACLADDPESAQAEQARNQLIRELIDRHGTSRVLFRNTRQSVKGFPQRIYHGKALPPADFLPADCPWQTALAPEHLIASWWEGDPRVDWLQALAKQLAGKKILVICRYGETAIRLAQVLREKQGSRVALFHEQMSLLERDRAAAYFAETENGAQFLLCSAIGSEGRNFQFAHHLVLFNLPENPDLLEQCIGRLDRIGQQDDVHIHVPYLQHSAQERLALWYDQGLNAFEESCPMGAALFEKCGQNLENFLQKPTALSEQQIFLAQTRVERDRLKKELEQGRDRLLEIHSGGGESARALAADIAREDGAPALQRFAQSLFDMIGLEQEELSSRALLLLPTGYMPYPDFPYLKPEGLTVSFDREFALAREEVEFLSWDHPLILNGMDLIVSSDSGKAAAARLSNKRMPTGMWLLELVYVVETLAPKALQLNRFLPPTPLRLLMDSEGKDWAAQVSFQTLQKQLKTLEKSAAQPILTRLKPELEALIGQGEKLLPALKTQLVEQVLAAANQQLGAEIDRLRALKTVNPSIKPSEIETLEQQREQSLIHLCQATWRLDSLRFMINYP